MSTMIISLPESLKKFVKKKVQTGAYCNNSEFIKELLRKEQDREQLRNLLIEGAQSESSSQPANKHYFQTLRKKIKK